MNIRVSLKAHRNARASVGTLQRRRADTSSPAVGAVTPSRTGKRGDVFVPSIVHDVLRSPGLPLEVATRSFMEPRFGHDYSAVSVSSRTPRLNRFPGGIGNIARANTPLGNCMSNGPSASPGPAPDAAAPLSGPGAGPTCANPGQSRTVTLRPVFLSASATDNSPTGGSWDRRYALTAAIWTKLGVSVIAATPAVVTTPLKTGGNDNHEANQIVALSPAAGVGVFLVDNDMQWTGGATTFDVGSATSQIVMSDRGTSDTLLAHEFGHALGLGHPEDNAADPDTVMQGSGSNSKSNPTRNTMGNYRRITWPAPAHSTCLYPDA